MNLLTGLIFVSVGVILYGMGQESWPWLVAGGALCLGAMHLMKVVERKDRAEKQATLDVVAVQFGFEPAPDLTSADLPFRFFQGARNARTQNVRKGTYEGLEIYDFLVVWDEKITVNKVDGGTTTETETHYSACAMAILGRPAKSLLASDHGWMPRYVDRDKLRIRDDLRKSWDLRGDPEYANELTDDPAAVEFLKGVGSKWYFEVSADGRVMCSRPEEETDEIQKRLDGLVGFARHLPKAS